MSVIHLKLTFVEGERYVLQSESYPKHWLKPQPPVWLFGDGAHRRWSGWSEVLSMGSDPQAQYLYTGVCSLPTHTPGRPRGAVPWEGGRVQAQKAGPIRNPTFLESWSWMSTLQTVRNTCLGSSPSVMALCRSVLGRQTTGANTRVWSSGTTCWRDGLSSTDCLCDITGDQLAK